MIRLEWVVLLRITTGIIVEKILKLITVEDEGHVKLHRQSGARSMLSFIHRQDVVIVKVYIVLCGLAIQRLYKHVCVYIFVYTCVHTHTHIGLRFADSQ